MKAHRKRLTIVVLWIQLQEQNMDSCCPASVSQPTSRLCYTLVSNRCYILTFQRKTKSCKLH